MGYPGGFSDKALAAIHLACDLAESKGQSFATLADLEEAIERIKDGTTRMGSQGA